MYRIMNGRKKEVEEKKRMRKEKKINYRYIV